MKTAILTCVLLSALASFAGEGDARKSFLETKGKFFLGASAVPADTVPPEYDFERAKGDAEWKIVLPVDDDDRVRFLTATIRGGKFSKGTLHTFGFKDEKITAARFAKLRETCPMLALRGGSLRVVKKGGKTLPTEVPLHAPTSRPLVYRAPPHPTSIHIDPCSRALGYSRGLLGQLHMSAGALRYEVSLEGPGGVTAELGIADASKGIPEKEAVKAIRAAVEKHSPERAGKVSDRDVVDFYAASRVVCKGVKRTP